MFRKSWPVNLIFEKLSVTSKTVSSAFAADNNTASVNLIKAVWAVVFSSDTADTL